VGAGTLNLGPLRPGRINVPGLSICPINPARAAMARLPSAPFICWPGPDQASTTAGLVVASSRATVLIVVALIPAVGGASVVVIVGIIQLATGHPISGGILVAWGLVVVSLVDNVARPFLLKGGMELHGGVVFFSLLGGLSVFGAIGLVIGPLVVTFLLAVVKMYEREYGRPPAGIAASVPEGVRLPAPGGPPPAGAPEPRGDRSRVGERPTH